MQEAEMLDLRFEINLQQICLVKIAASLWENKDMKQKVQFFVEETYRKYNCEIKNELHWNKVMKDVLSLINSLSLPAKFNSTLRHITRSMGLKIYSWIKYITKTLLLDSICIEDIFWTQYGTLNKIKILENWVKKERLEITELFNTACFLYKEDCISNLWEKIPKAIKKSKFYSKTIYEESTYSHIAYWKNLLEKNVMKYFETYAFEVNEEIGKYSRFLEYSSELAPPESYNLSRRLGLFLSPVPHAYGFEESMINLSLTQGQEFAIQHFWDKLDDKEGKKLSRYIRYLDPKKSLPEYADTILFIVTKMFMKERKKCTAEECFGLLMLLSNHPWDEFFLPVFDRISKYLDMPNVYRNINSRFNFLQLLERIIELMNHEFELYGTVENSVYQNFLHETWKRIPTWASLERDEEWDIIFNKILSNLLLIEDIQSLKLIINSEEFRAERCKRLNAIFWGYLGSPHIFLILTDRQTELMHRFVDEVELGDEERSNLKKNFCKFNTFRL